MENGYYWARKIEPSEWEVVEVCDGAILRTGVAEEYGEDDFEFGNEVVCEE